MFDVLKTSNPTLPLTMALRISLVASLIIFARSQSCSWGEFSLLGAWLAAINCPDNYDNHFYNATGTLFIASYVILLLGIENTLLLRLHYTFKESIYKLTSRQSLTLVILFIILTIFAFAVASLYALYTAESVNIGEYGYLSMLIVVAVGGILYLLATIYSMYLFARKLLILTKLRATSMKNVMDENALKLNKTQTKLIKQTSRYITLITIAMITSSITITIFIFWRSNTIMVAYFDCTINVICLYLQYPFATKYYDKYCGCFGKYLCLNKILRENTKKSMERKYRNSMRSSEVIDNMEQLEMKTPESDHRLVPDSSAPNETESV